MDRLEFKFEFEKCHKVYGALIKMKDIIKEYGQVRVADVKELCGQESTYTDNHYGWEELRTYHVVYNATSKKYSLHLPKPEPLNGWCTDDRCTENRYGYRCPHCQSLNIREVSGYHEEGAPYGTIGYECTDCHTTFTVDVFDEAALKKENEQLRQELEETIRLLTCAEFYMNSGQDIHIMYPNWYEGYHKTVRDIQEYIRKNK